MIDLRANETLPLWNGVLLWPKFVSFLNLVIKKDDKMVSAIRTYARRESKSKYFVLLSFLVHIYSSCAWYM